MYANNPEQEWDLEIKPHDSVFNLHLKDVWNYRDLLWLLVRRDFVSFYKQTILGPLWFFIQPIFTTVIYTFVFGNLAKIGTNGAPGPVFYMAGIVAWNYFSDCLTKTSTVFRDNAAIFGKVYFPRLIMPLSIVVSNLVKFAIQLVLFFIIIGYYMFKGANIQPNIYLLLFPIVILLMAILGLGLGLIVTAMTTKYRDLAFVVSFGIQLFMYATPVIYSLSTAIKNHHEIIAFNPMSGLIETFRYGFTGTGEFYPQAFFISVVASIILFFIGLVVFNRVEKNFVDTV
ncbi:ABC transporter permease [Mucilaginibacter pallidiroseus]|uniref:Transport permease protein n=1 Tax=Mucilaginibacter pallidiroseus TaxID=2599295 RepID=A0A563U8C3_9SPHI|nr:ABC transporter permease [Mucilaginibacter pallidiroseus]TWR27564.1 ABC transporter permease [Mucilaginibacter pallidiroseus]